MYYSRSRTTSHTSVCPCHAPDGLDCVCCAKRPCRPPRHATDTVPLAGGGQPVVISRSGSNRSGASTTRRLSQDPSLLLSRPSEIAHAPPKENAHKVRDGGVSAAHPGPIPLHDNHNDVTLTPLHPLSHTHVIPATKPTNACIFDLCRRACSAPTRSWRRRSGRRPRRRLPARPSRASWRQPRRRRRPSRRERREATFAMFCEVTFYTLVTTARCTAAPSFAQHS